MPEKPLTFNLFTESFVLTYDDTKASWIIYDTWNPYHVTTGIKHFPTEDGGCKVGDYTIYDIGKKTAYVIDKEGEKYESIYNELRLMLSILSMK